MDSTQAKEKNLQLRLVLNFLYEQIANDKNVSSEIEEQNQYIVLYYKSLKNDNEKRRLLSEEHNVYMDSFRVKSLSLLNDELSFFFNLIEFALVGNFPDASLPYCFEILTTLVLELKEDKTEYILKHYFTKVMLAIKHSPQEKCLLLLKSHQAITAKDPFHLFLLYLEVNEFLKRNLSFEYQIEMEELFSFNELILFLQYSLRELNLAQFRKYFELFQDKQKGFKQQKVFFIPQSFLKYNYYQHAYHLFTLSHKDISMIQPFNNDSKHIDLVMMVNSMTNYAIGKNDNSFNQLMKIINGFTSKNINHLILRQRQIERGNECIMKQIQTSFLSPIQLFRLLYSFYHNCRIMIKVNMIELECDFIEDLLQLILQEHQSIQWKTFFLVPLSRVILLYIFLWYIKSKYSNKSNAKDYQKIILFYKMYKKILNVFPTTFNLNKAEIDSIFKEFYLYLQNMKANAYYKLGQYNKARNTFFKILSKAPGNWRVELKIALCSLKLYDKNTFASYANRAHNTSNKNINKNKDAQILLSYMNNICK